MDYKFNWHSPIVTRVAILLATTFAFVYAFEDDGNVSALIKLGLGAAIAFQVIQLVKLVERQAQTVSPLTGLRFDETTFTFKSDVTDATVQREVDELNQKLARFRQGRKERDSENQFFKNIVQHVSIGLLTFTRDGRVQMINAAARRLLRIEQAETLQDIRQVSEPLVEAFERLKTGGRELVRLKDDDETIQLAVFAIELTLRGDEVKLISMNNIQSELEEKEMEAWQNLVRVLTHEIMNSVTPISSLAGIVEEEIGKKKNKLQGIPHADLDDMHLSLQTISKRSEGLIRFVKEFRNLTHVAKPRLAEVPVKPLLEELAMLHKKELTDMQVKLIVRVAPEQLVVSADKAMLEQVLINLVKNAIQAFGEKTDREIVLVGFEEDGRPVITVKDNGVGIEAEALEKIFIPFYSTKKTGSGIGLSLSKQIMRQHGGRISVKSEPGTGTEFTLRF
jgi:nitrogen fixation/metabolism regulation signal transduction histidine kinase